ncbi:UDP-2,4-diacetamido-2,4,6-trideoxy-beta-L-altropyranose hydrolase [Domibacillus enclensis]|uniref:UDP-2,4-diacetamido-2,4, 6-trideoxy-beta-L-altropyranose hydrolase n=1 Tax=Domibacillus enclensis TaxID=1017273 RepID=A0A1N6SE78_9BACI|nr:UDP-2,4-diacetamido-2,4,6-trideoxy-beta-L-altropyranose hydrolase [Domibacillus enclensis]OXS79298.1 UDP-2,4-diacetamido-2,4,6-trideoxy-beta-L-altropyranose hydrolase [Domibacillus enclensis]SIQ39282.1 UDP-2,4-diacetamido-2,4,6-trideoxy-beta-L-altropyranose hydrolase [Domibacillus enclensis]
MEILIRTDASVTIGSGHVMRCLTIARALRKKGHRVTFFMKELPGNLIELVQENGFSLTNTWQSADICIVDHYQMDQRQETSIRSFVKKIVVIDDLANRPHDCDVLIDQNIVPNFKNRYADLVPDHCVTLLGPKYLIVRDEFTKERTTISPRTGEVNRLLIFMGGSDPSGETLKVLQALQGIEHRISHIDVVVGIGNPDRSYIKQLCEEQGFHYHYQIEYMASLMARADFSIGAGGSATWERCYVGLPSSSTIVAENQSEATQTAASLGAVWNIGWHEQVTGYTYEQIILSLPNKIEEIKQLSMSGLELTEQPNGANTWIDYITEVEK